MRCSIQLSYESISSILRGKGPERPTSRLLRGVAEALRLPAERVFDVVGRTMPEPWLIPERLWVIPPAMRASFEVLMASAVELMEPTERTR